MVILILPLKLKVLQLVCFGSVTPNASFKRVCLLSFTSGKRFTCNWLVWHVMNGFTHLVLLPWSSLCTYFQIKASMVLGVKDCLLGYNNMYFAWCQCTEFFAAFSTSRWKTCLILNVLSGWHMKNVVDMHPQIKIKCFPVARTVRAS
jgi:hypothetical protein